MKNLRADFPILAKKINGKPLIYFDNAATTQKPQSVIDSLVDFYSNYNANTHRGVHDFAERATAAYELARTKVADFIGADSSEIVFTRGTTDSINCVASSWAQEHIKEGDEILLTELEHHSNLLPWQRIAERANARLLFIPTLPDGTVDMKLLPELLTRKTKLVAITHVSNMFGSHVDIQTIIKQAKLVGAKVLIDAAQSASHQRINARALGADFIAFSGHKMLGPTGIGVLYVNKALHEHMPVYQLGGGMVYEADYRTAQWLKMPYKLEAGTPAIAQAIGLGAAIDYLTNNIDFNDLRTFEASLVAQLIDGLSAFDRIRVLGPLDELKQSGSLASFIVDGIHPHDVAAYLNEYGIFVRAGHHCAQPVAKLFGFDSSVRASFYFYNTSDEVAMMLNALAKMLKVA